MREVRRRNPSSPTSATRQACRGFKQDHYLRELLGVGPSEPAAPHDPAEEERAVLRDLERSATEAQLLQTLSNASSEVRDRVAEAAVERLTAPDLAQATEHSLQRFGPLLQPNPRSMKRFVNTYSVLRAVRTLEGNTVPSEPLALWTILETRWPTLADYLRSKPEAIELVGKPATDLDEAPEDLRALFDDPAVRRLADFEDGGLTAILIQACCGAAEPPSPPSA